MHSATLLAVSSCIAYVLACGCASPSTADEVPGVDVTEVSKWPTDIVTMKDGRRLGGLIRHEDKRFVELVEVVRKPGRPMGLLVRWIPLERIARIQRLDQPQRRQLQARIRRFRNRTQIAAALHQQIELSTRKLQAIRYLHYDGPWFSLDSTADEELTREAIVRTEQMFAGFRTFIRPQMRPTRPMRIILLSTQEEYLAYQLRDKLTIKNAAYFDPNRNEIVAGGDLASLNARLIEIRKHHQEMLDHYKRLEEELRQKLIQLTEMFRAQGADEEKLRQVRTAARRQWREMVEQQELKIRQAERDNDAVFQEKFRVLYHEAFHAYLDNYVYDKATYEVPRWLNEGLAQVFENGLLDAGTLRLDAPDPAILAALQKELQSDRRLQLRDVLLAPDRQFLVGHGDTARRSDRLYVYSWGIAYHLMFNMHLLDSEAIERYLSAGGVGPSDPLRRFEALVDMPLGRFENEWRAAMLAL
jgi:hypothetical protein